MKNKSRFFSRGGLMFIAWLVLFSCFFIPLNFVDSLNSVLPHALLGRLMSLTRDISHYYAKNDSFPTALEELGKWTGEPVLSYVDPYSPDQSLFGYKTIQTVTSEYCEIYIVRLAAPAVLIAATTGTNEFAREYSPEFKQLRTQLELEMRDEALRPNPNLIDRYQFLLSRFRKWLWG